MQSWNAGIYFVVVGYSLAKFNCAAQVGSDDLGYGPGSGFSLKPVQTSTTKPLLKQKQYLKYLQILRRLRRKRTVLLLSGPKSSFQIKVNLGFCLKIKVWSLEEEWRGTESKLLDIQYEVPKSVMICGAVMSPGVGSLWFIKSNVNGIYEISSRERWETVDPTIQTSWRLNSASVPQADRFHAPTSLMLEFVLKEPRPSIECINEHTLKNFSVVQILFFFIDLRKYSNILRYWIFDFHEL